MSSYLGRHAELYDLFYADKPYHAEAQFVAEQLSSRGVSGSSRLLEIACGTGRHARHLENLGYQIVAVDYSEDMLEIARRSAQECGSKVDFRFGDMRELALPDEPFDAAVCLFDSIGYAQSNEGILKSLCQIAKHVKVGGWFVFEFWHAAAMLRSFEPVRVRRWKTDDGEILRISETSLESQKQLAHVNYTVYDMCSLGSYYSFSETQTNRYFLIQEMAAMLENSGWEAPHWYSGFSKVKEIDETTWHVVSVARRSSKIPA
jgi:SAM-dependent methyltransferase